MKMRNALLSLLLTSAIIACFSFSNAKHNRAITDDYDDDEDDGSIEVADTTPLQKKKGDNSTAMFDSFGKPTHGDSASAPPSAKKQAQPAKAKGKDKRTLYDSFGKPRKQ